MQISQNPNLSQCSGSYEDLTDGPKYLKKKTWKSRKSEKNKDLDKGKYFHQLDN